MLRNVLIICLITLFVSCRNESRYVSLGTISDTIVYQSDKTSDSSQDFQCEGIISLQQLVVKVALPEGEIDSVFEKEISSWEIHTQEGSRSSPKKIQRMSLEGGNVEFALIYRPIHSRKMFQQLGLHGNLEQRYALSVGGNTPIPITCELSSDDFGTALTKHGRKVITEYSVVVPETLKQSLRESADSAHSFHSIENEILIQGVWFRIQSYHEDDSLITRLRVVNQSGSSINCDLNKVVLISDGIAIPSSISNQDELVISNGRRAELQFSYACPKKDQYLFNLSSLSFAKNELNKTLFSEPLILRMTN
jgi:hypothetical protein